MLNKTSLRQPIAASLLAAVLAFAGCSKNFTDVDPQGQQQSQQFWQNQDDALKGVNAIYGNLRFWTQVAFAPIYVESMGSDEVEKGSVPGDADFMNEPHNFVVTPTAGQVADFWAGQYQNVNLCNQVLDNVPAIEMDAALKARLLAEAKFIRAYSYFRLVRAFGDVPLRLHLPVDASEYNLPRAPKAEVWAAIEQDLTDAASVLPQTYGPADVGRATKGAALGLHAKVAMYQAKWAEVLDLTNQVKTLGYGLFPNYEQLFRVPNENSIESVFEIQCNYYPSIPGVSNCQYSQVQGPRGVNGFWGFHVPSAVLDNAYEPGDLRRDGTIMYVGETTPEGDLIPSPGATGPGMYNQKAYTPFSEPFDDANARGSQQNVRVLRYADVLLMNAEAANELNNPALAQESMNLVRERAGLDDITSNDQATLRQAIWQERRVELAMEFDRYFDVIRQGRGEEVFGDRGFVVGKSELMPVPQTQIQLSGGVLTQNPNY